MARTLRITLVTALLVFSGAGVAYGTYCWVGGKPIPIKCASGAAKQYHHGCSPVAVTLTECSPGKKTATLRGIVFPNNLETKYHFEYRKVSPSSSPWISTPEKTLPKGLLPVTVSAPISGLTSNTKYYVRLVAVNYMGSYTGVTQSFTTTR